MLFPGPDRLRGKSVAGRARFPITRWSSRRCTTACTTPWTSMACKRLAASVSRRGDIKVVARDLLDAVAAGRGNPHRAALRLSRRRAARRAAHQRGVAAPLARSGNRRRHGQARSRGHRRGARTGLAGSHERRRAARCACIRLGVITEQEGASAGWTGYLDELIDARRATRLHDGAATSSGCAPNACR